MLDSRYAKYQTLANATAQTGDLAVAGTVSATAFAGSGAALTGVPAASVGGMTWGASLDPAKDVKAYVDAQLCRARGGAWGGSGCNELVKLVVTVAGDGPARGGAWWDPAKNVACSKRTDGYTNYCGVDQVTQWWSLAYGAGVAQVPADWVMVLGSGPRLSLANGNSETNITTAWPTSGWLCHPTPSSYRLSASSVPFTMSCMGWSDGYAGRYVACCR